MKLIAPYRDDFHKYIWYRLLELPWVKANDVYKVAAYYVYPKNYPKFYLTSQALLMLPGVKRFLPFWNIDDAVLVDIEDAAGLYTRVKEAWEHARGVNEAARGSMQAEKLRREMVKFVKRKTDKLCQRQKTPGIG